MSDPLLAAARHLVDESLRELHASLEGLPAEGLSWRPPGKGTNSIAVLAIHALSATRLWLRMATGQPLPDRDRDSEFRTTAADPAAFRRLVTELSRDGLAALESDRAIDWGTHRPTLGRGGDAPAEVTAAYALVHATEHLRGHVDQISLTRRLWDARAS